MRKERKKRDASGLEYFYLHALDRPVSYEIVYTRENKEDLDHYFEYELEYDDPHNLIIIEEQKIVKSQPGRIKKIFCLARRNT